MLVLVMLVRPFVSCVFLFFAVALLACKAKLFLSLYSDDCFIGTMQGGLAGSLKKEQKSNDSGI
jgi:hypothetical protein